MTERSDDNAPPSFMEVGDDNMRRVRPWIAALLTFVMGPGVGLFYARRTKAAVVWTLSLLLVSAAMIAAVILACATAKAPVLLPTGVTPQTALTLLSYTLGVLFAVWVWVSTARQKQAPKSSPVRLLGYLALYAVPIVFAAIIRFFAYQPFTIPSEAMTPTLRPGDYLFVSKSSYGYSRYSFSPFSGPFPSGRAFAGKPERGDLVVFKLPSDSKTDYIKRIVGLPGDDLQVVGGALYLNGKAVRREALQSEVAKDEYGVMRDVVRWRETLPNGKNYVTYDLIPDGGLDDTPVYHVPPNHYFMMGDNRDNSQDSRVLSVVGYVPFDNLLGRMEGQPIRSENPARTE